MKVQDIYQRAVLSADADETLGDVASRMQYHEVGALPVFEGREMIGIITERDLLRALADGININTALARDCMTADATTITPDTDVAKAAMTMVIIGARHLPVLEGRRVVGMVSARDLLEVMAAAGRTVRL